ncbi:MAG: SPOR domain-containing protein [Magnetococcales bacterium]|nr:SPOR domain-containing protein [Magnetococcales bacterium]
MDRPESHANRNRSPFSGFLFLTTALLFGAVLGVETAQAQDVEVYRSPGKHYYVPDHYFSPYNYQSTGDFTKRPMVIPPSVPVFNQPAYFIMDGPQAVPSAPIDHTQFIGRSQPVANLSQQSGYLPQQPGYAAAPQQAAPQMATQSPYGYAQQPVGMTTASHPQSGGYSFAPVSPKQTYTLHVGSFLIYSQADAIEQQVLALGLTPIRKEVEAEGIRYLQLHVGPFSDPKSVKQIADKLDENQIKNRIVVVR